MATETPLTGKQKSERTTIAYKRSRRQSTATHDSLLTVKRPTRFLERSTFGPSTSSSFHRRLTATNCSSFQSIVSSNQWLDRFPRFLNLHSILGRVTVTRCELLRATDPTIISTNNTPALFPADTQYKSLPSNSNWSRCDCHAEPSYIMQSQSAGSFRLNLISLDDSLSRDKNRNKTSILFSFLRFSFPNCLLRNHLNQTSSVDWVRFLIFSIDFLWSNNV